MDRASMSSHRFSDGSHIYFGIDQDTDTLVILPTKGEYLRVATRDEQIGTTQAIVRVGEIPFKLIGKTYG